jgi:hypothetical protein
VLLECCERVGSLDPADRTDGRPKDARAFPRRMPPPVCGVRMPQLANPVESS